MKIFKSIVYTLSQYKVPLFLKYFIIGITPFFLLGVIYEYIQLSFDTGRRSTKAIDDYLLNNKKDNE